jgi:hypothetical protein
MCIKYPKSVRAKVVWTIQHLGPGVFRNVRTILHIIIWVLNYQDGLGCPINITLFYPVFFKQLYIQLIQSGEGGGMGVKGVLDHLHVL